jgi:hypothetical protein
VLREVRATYKLVFEGVMNLVDKFFEMDRTDAIRGLELYKVGRVCRVTTMGENRIPVVSPDLTFLFSLSFSFGGVNKT